METGDESGLDASDGQGGTWFHPRERTHHWKWMADLDFSDTATWTKTHLSTADVTRVHGHGLRY